MYTLNPMKQMTGKTSPPSKTFPLSKTAVSRQVCSSENLLAA